MIDVSSLTVVFGRTVALDELDLHIDEGITGLFGANGSGKSTLLRCLAGLVRPTKGTLAFAGAPVSLRDRAFRSQIGYAGHEAGLYPRLTVRENLGLFARLYGSGEERVHAVIDRLGLSDYSETLASDLSAGYGRRASVARALLHQPRLLLLDEPYANLDDDAAELVSKAILEWRSEGGAVALVATHGARKVKSYADSGLILQRGRVVRFGSYHEMGVRQ